MTGPSPKKCHTSQSFNRVQVQAMHRLFSKLDSVPEARMMIAGDEILAVRRKFLAMHAKHVAHDAAQHDTANQSHIRALTPNAT